MSDRKLTGRRGGRVAALGLAAAMGLSALVGGTAFGTDEPVLPERGGPGGADRPVAEYPDGLGDGEVRTVFVHLDGRSAVQAYDAAPAGQGARAALATQDEIEAEADRVFRRATAQHPGAQRVYATTNAVPGVVLTTDDAAIAAISADPAVLAVYPVVNKTVQNTGAVEHTQTLAEWTSTGLLGEDVSIGIIDTGVDYTHTGFGGPGTAAAYEAAAAPEANGPDIPWAGTAKVVGGYDFAGDDYDGSNAPSPDHNPLDCQGHGSHVAGSAAGFGVNADGSTFAGEYADLTLTDLRAMRMGPGTAPLADIYALRVFGCEGSTGLVMQALDWALDPNGDGDFSDRLDVINMSLGMDYGAEDDPENLFVDALAEYGVLTLSAMGNAGDLTHIGGSPGNAVRGIAVANSVAGAFYQESIQVDAPAEVAGIWTGQYSINYEGYATLDLGPLEVVELASVQPDNPEGCAPYSGAAAAAVAGKAVWVEWPADFACGSTARADLSEAAGAAAVVFSSTEDIFTAGMSGNATQPLFQFTATSTAALRPALGDGTLEISFDSELVPVVTEAPDAADTINPSTSRGSNGVVKPDLAAPGTQIGSVAVGSGDGLAVMSGTSMATPHAAGIAALVREARPDWSIEQLKASMMNTAGHDLFTGPGGTGEVYGPNRVGAGRVNAQAAVSATLVAYADAGSGAVSASFGPVTVPIDGGVVTLTKDITIENFGADPVTAELAYEPVVSQPGVEFTVTAPSVAVPAGDSATVAVTATIDPAELRRSLDPTMEREQLGFDRFFVADASGRVLVIPDGGTALRVPVHVAAEPASTTTASLTARDGSAALSVRGTGVDQGNLGFDNYTGFTAVYQLLAASERMPDCDTNGTSACIPTAAARAYDVRHVGASSDIHEVGAFEDAYVSFAIATWGEWAHTGNLGYFNTYIATADDQFLAIAWPVPDTDLYVVDLYRLTADGADHVTDSWVNEFPPNVDGNVFDTNLLTFGFLATDLFPGGEPADSRIHVEVLTESLYAAPDDGYVVDYLDAGVFDVAEPGIWAETSWYVDTADFTTEVHRAAGSDASHVMVTHTRGTELARADILPYRDGSQVDFAEAIDWFIDEGLTTETAAGFRPTAPVTRQAMAAFLHRYAEGSAAPAPCTAAAFTDVPASHPFCAEITWLADQGITTGYSDGRFRPNDPVSREAMGAFLERFAGAPMSETQECEASSGFRDVPNDSPFCRSVRWVTAETGVSGGFGDGLFRPTAPISREAMASFLQAFNDLVLPREL